MTNTDACPGPSADAYGEKLLTAFLGALETLGIYVGDRLGWFRSLAEQGPATAAQLAVRTGTSERYCREWLEMQASFGTVEVASDHRADGATASADRVFLLPSGPAEVLIDEHSLSFLGALPRLMGAVGPQLPQLLEAYRNGGGVTWAQLGDDAREAQAALNRPWFDSRLAPALGLCADVDAVLRANRARIADVGCGGGWSTIALAKAYPQARLVGFDIDPPSIDMARAAADEAGVDDRVTFRLAEAETLSEPEQFDAAFLFECLHDMPRPVEVLSSVRRSVRRDGVVVVMDEAVADEFTAPGNEVDQLMYGFSMFICLPDGLSSTPSSATGTVFRRPILQRYAAEAGFHRVEVLPIEDFSLFRFYRLRH